MARTTTTKVQEIMDTTLTDAQIVPFINIANRIVTRRLSATTLTAAELADIETFLTAHIIAMTKERQPSEEKVGDIWVRYQGSFGMNLEQTTYGQMVLEMDSTGNMQRSAKKKIRIRAIQQDSDDASELTTDQW